MYIDKYDFFFFDCDGVILDSNKIKTKAFEHVVRDHLDGIVEQVVSYYSQQAGSPRVDKIRYFFEVLSNEKLTSVKQEKLLDAFYCRVISDLLACKTIEGVEEFLTYLSGRNKRCFVVSGAPQDELCYVLDKKNIGKYFKRILGSPVAKVENLVSLLNEFQIASEKAVLFGDSKLDYECAKNYGLDFVFVSEKTEFKEYESFFKNKKVEIIPNFRGILEFL